MAGRGYASDDRETTRVYTPSMDSDDDLQHTPGLSLNERNYRLFQFRKEGRSWANAPLCTESTMSEAEIKKRSKRTKKPTHSVDHQLEKMSQPRRMAIEDLIESIQRRDPDGDRWDVIAIDNDNPERTKRTGEVLAFSVTLARVGANTTRQRTGSLSQDRRRSTYLSPQREYAVPEARRPKSYHPQSPTRDRRSPRQSDAFRKSHTIVEDDPFGSTLLFSNDGKPVNPQGSAAFTNAGLPPHIPLDEPIGAKPQKLDKQNKSRKSKKGQDDDIVDLDALLGNTGLGGDDDDLVQIDDDQDLGFDSPIEVFGEPEKKTRGRKRTDSGWGEKTPKRGMSRSKSKSKPRRPSIHIPRDEAYGRPIPEVTPASGRRRQQAYWGSHGSATTPSIHSDQSVLEAEYEEYSSSGSSVGWQEAHPYESSGRYMPADGRYMKATRDHRRGPPSPQQPRYEMAADHAYIPQSATTRRPRQERFPSDGTIQRYSHSFARPPLISQYSAPRFTPSSAHPATSMYTYDAGLVPFPTEMAPAPMRRRESMQVQDAQLYMQQDQDRDREIELLRRERDLAVREAEMHQEVARRASVRTSTSKYSHEPRLMQRDRRYSGAYHG